MAKPVYTGLVGDVGGTNARFALVDEKGHIRNPRSFPARNYATLSDVIAEYLETTCGRKRLGPIAVEQKIEKVGS